MRMTKEEAIRIIKIVMAVVEDFEIIVQGEKFTEEKCKEAIDVVTKALEQKSCEDCPVLDKIVDEISEYKSRKVFGVGIADLETGKQTALDYVLAIIDQCRQESEEKG